MNAKDELKNIYFIELTPKEKIKTLYKIKDYIDDKLMLTTTQRVGLLAISQVITECIEMLKVYYSIDEGLRSVSDE